MHRKTVQLGLVLLCIAATADSRFGLAAGPAQIATSGVSGQQKGVTVSDINRKIEPCDDFYEFSNGNWRAANPIPPAKPRWGRRTVAREINRQQVRDILNEASMKRDSTKGSAEQILGDFYAACMNETSIDSFGATPILPLMSMIENVRNNADVQRVIRRLHDQGMPALFTVAGAMDNKEPRNFIASIAPSGLGLPNRDAYLKADTQSVAALRKYREHMIQMLKLAGRSP